MSNKMSAPDQQAMDAVPEPTPVPDPRPVNPAPGISEEATTKPDPAVPEEGAPKQATSEPDPAPAISVPDPDVPGDTGLQFLDTPDDTGLQPEDVPDDTGLQLALLNDGGPIPNPPRQTKPKMTKLPISKDDMVRWHNLLSRFLSKLSDPDMRREVYENVRQCYLA